MMDKELTQVPSFRGSFDHTYYVQSQISGDRMVITNCTKQIPEDILKELAAIAARIPADADGCFAFRKSPIQTHPKGNSI